MDDDVMTTSSVLKYMQIWKCSSRMTFLLEWYNLSRCDVNKTFLGNFTKYFNVFQRDV